VVTVATATDVRRLLAGPSPERGAEPLAGHLQRVGPRPWGTGALVDALHRGGLRGRGGAAFPTARKWAAVAARSRGDAVVIANGAEGEPASWKDRTLMRLRPHLVLDGLLLAAETVRAEEAIVYLPRQFDGARAALMQALAERRAAGERGVAVRLVAGPHRYVAGEESAVVAALNGREAKPTFRPPRPFERGVRGRPTLVQNVETLAHAALLARHGGEWFRSAGDTEASGTALVSLGGAVSAPGVCEIALGTTLGDLVAAAGGLTEPAQAVLIGGYGGRWLGTDRAWQVRLGVDVPLGAGVVAVLPAEACGLAETAAVLRLLAREGARQCGPCINGLGAMASTMAALTGGRGRPGDAERLALWSRQVAGRGTCHHPDGAALLLTSALETFARQVAVHQPGGGCPGCRRPRLLPTPAMETRWR
jgi:NADH:ubiquinone oxidoreductase subunit F (NADH-binding)